MEFSELLHGFAKVAVACRHGFVEVVVFLALCQTKPSWSLTYKLQAVRLSDSFEAEKSSK